MAVETSAGNTEGDINFEVKEGGGGNECLTCGARARLVGANEAVRTWHGRSAEGAREGNRWRRCRRRGNTSGWFT